MLAWKAGWSSSTAQARFTIERELLCTTELMHTCGAVLKKNYWKEMKINMNGKRSSILLVLLHQVEYAPNSQTAFPEGLARASEKHNNYLFTHTCMTSVTSPYRSVPGTRRKYTDIAVENAGCRHFTHARALGPFNIYIYIYTRNNLSLEQYLITDVCIWWQAKRP